METKAKVKKLTMNQVTDLVKQLHQNIDVYRIGGGFRMMVQHGRNSQFFDKEETAKIKNMFSEYFGIHILGNNCFDLDRNCPGEFLSANPNP